MTNETTENTETTNTDYHVPYSEFINDDELHRTLYQYAIGKEKHELLDTYTKDSSKEHEKEIDELVENFWKDYYSGPENKWRDRYATVEESNIQDPEVVGNYKWWKSDWKPYIPRKFEKDDKELGDFFRHFCDSTMAIQFMIDYHESRMDGKLSSRLNLVLDSLFETVKEMYPDVVPHRIYVENADIAHCCQCS